MMAINEWIKSAGEKLRDAVEQALPPAPRPERVPIRIPVNYPHSPRRYS
ncbi:MAG: hypothetical protein ACR2M3_18260 [Thermomicrobiales bacterium]